MRITLLVGIAAAVIVGASTRVYSSDAAQTPALSGKMAALKYLIGTWSCTTKIDAIGKTPASTVAGKQMFWIEPGNVIGSYYSSKPYSSSGFMGWMAPKKLWWSNNADRFSGVIAETGKDSGSDVQSMAGTNWFQGQASTARDTMTKVSDTSFHDTFENVQGGKVVFRGTSSCTKSSNKTM